MGAAAEDLREAARHLVDPIEHNRSGLFAVIGGIAGFVVGAVVVLALVSNPIGWVAIGTALAVGSVGIIAGEFAGKQLGKLFDYDAGDIKEGSPDTTVGDRSLAAARVYDPVKCHEGKRIATGCRDISINRQPATRVKEKTECDGKIKEGCKTVLYGGPSEQYLEIKEPDLPRWYTIFKEAVDWASLAFSIPKLIGLGAFKLLFKPGFAKALFAPLRESWKAAWATKGTWMRAFKVTDTVYSAGDALVTPTKKVVEGKTWFSDRMEFTNSTWYRTADYAWTGLGTGLGVTKAYQAWRAPNPLTPKIQTPEPAATPGYSAKPGGTVVTRDLPPGHVESPGGVAYKPPTIVEAPYSGPGANWKAAEGSKILTRPNQGIVIAREMPPVAPRSTAPRGEGQFFELPGEAPRNTRSFQLFDADNNPIPGPAPKAAPAGPEVPRNLDPEPPSALPPNPATKTDVDIDDLAAARNKWLDARRTEPIKGGGKVLKLGDKIYKDMTKPEEQGPFPQPFSP